MLFVLFCEMFKQFIDIINIRVLLTISMEIVNNINNLLMQKGFIWVDYSQNIDYYLDEDLESYKDWEIYLDIPNGGVLAVDIIHRDSGGTWSYSTYPQFDYLDADKIIDFVRSTIDEIENKLKQKDNCMGIQLTLF